MASGEKLRLGGDESGERCAAELCKERKQAQDPETVHFSESTTLEVLLSSFCFENLKMAKIGSSSGGFLLACLLLAWACAPSQGLFLPDPGVSSFLAHHRTCLGLGSRAVGMKLLGHISVEMQPRRSQSP